MSISYSLVVTWTYFFVYVTIFFIVSVICAVKVQNKYKKYATYTTTSTTESSVINTKQAYNPKDWTRKGLFKQWYQLLWKKKKVYLQLIPHFFDQATDLGVIIEYWHLRNDADVIGINTMYLFVVSVCVIILHRIISSFAIYRLTNNKSFILYQIFDVLMVKCIWTNYQLDTDEPSNSQRYLQTLEATFESAPQILIATAFLVKASISDASAIVILSLITSFWTLSSRVSADDKMMFQKDWKNIEFHYNVFPCINIKYIIRVIFWRFLEISSRIILLCLVWINIGGLSIFIILGTEFVYLGIVCFGLGTVDMMGNIIYLCAANSNKSSQGWAIKMTFAFWSYRVISAWILLIMVSVFATTNFDLPKIQSYEARRSQTIIDNIGFALFIYAWITTPIWQWIGAVVVFDYKSLSSTARDVEQLIHDKKWNEVIELIEFGASFPAAHTLSSMFEADQIDNNDAIIQSIFKQCTDTIHQENN
eukprot:9678_1